MNRITLPVWRVCFGVHACTVRASFPICRLCEMCQLCICVHLSAYLPIHLWFSFFAFVLCLFCWLITRIMRQSCVRITIGHNVHMLLYAVAHNLIHMREKKTKWINIRNSMRITFWLLYVITTSILLRLRNFAWTNLYYSKCTIFVRAFFSSTNKCTYATINDIHWNCLSGWAADSRIIKFLLHSVYSNYIGN